MRAFPEPVRIKPIGQSFIAFRHAAASFPFYWHYHPEFELTYVERGSGTRYVGDSIRPFQSGDLVLLGGNLPHTWCSDNRSASPRSHGAIVVHFPRDLFVSGAPEFEAIQGLLRAAERGLVFGPGVARAAARQLRSLPRLGGLAAWCGLVKLLDCLARTSRSEPLVSPGYAPRLSAVAQRRIERILQCVETQAGSSELGLAGLSRLVHMSPASLSRFFRQMTGRTLVSHITQTRLGMACRKLIESDDGVAVIAFSCGFENLANFNRHFRRSLGMTPTAYRSRFNRRGSWPQVSS